MSNTLIETDDEFYTLINDYDSLVNFLISLGLIAPPPTRCKNCYKYNTFKLTTRKTKRKQKQSNNSFIKLEEKPYYSTYRCKK